MGTIARSYNVDKMRDIKVHYNLIFTLVSETRVEFLPEETYFSGTPGIKVEETYFFQFCPDKTGRNWTKLEKTMKEKCWKK